MTRSRSNAAALAALASMLFASGCATLTDPESTTAANATITVASPVPLPEPAPPVPAPATDPAFDSTPPPGPPARRARLDPLQDAERSDLWQRLRTGFAMADVDNDLVRKWEQWYARDPAYVQRMAERGGRYMFHVLEEVQRRGLPAELVLLPFIESAFNPQAESHARASGMWQFMPATGRDFELRQNLFRDDRRSVLGSTRAALDYLQKLHGMFGDWQLALAAYNWGQGNVSRALERSRRAGLPADYENLRMPQETREYVPKLQAVKNIVLNPQAFALQLAPIGNHPFFLSVAIERDIDVVLAAKLAGLPLEEFQQLNPQMNKPVILAAGTPHVLLPYDNANLFLRQLPLHRGALASWTAWQAPRTLKPAEAARLVGVDEAQLRAVNRIPPRMLVKVGSTLLVPRGAHTTVDVAEHIADNGALALAPEARPLKRVSVKAGRGGDSVAALAKRYRVSAAQLGAWNGVSPLARFNAGQTVVLMLPQAPPRAATGTRSVHSAAPGTRSAHSAAPAARAHAPAPRPATRRAKRH